MLCAKAPKETENIRQKVVADLLMKIIEVLGKESLSFQGTQSNAVPCAQLYRLA